MYKQIIYFAFGFFFLFFCCPLKSKGQTYNFDYYSVNQGLSQSQVNCLFEDSRGFLWCGTAGGGICRFDGKNFKTYNSKDGLVGQIINTITEDQKGNLWIGTTWGGLEKFDGNHFSNYTMNEGLRNNHVKTICVDNEGKIWVGTNVGIAILENGKISLFKNFPVLENCIVYKIIQDNTGKIWIATSKGLYVYNKATEYLDVHILPANEVVKNIHQSPSGKILLITISNKVFVFESNSPHSKAHQFIYFDSLAQYNISSAAYDEQNNCYYFGTLGSGILKVCKDAFSHINSKNGLSSKMINCVKTGSQGVMWVGTSGSGLASLRNKSFFKFDLPNGKGVSNIFAICQGENKEIWIGTRGDGIFVVRNGRLLKLSSQISIVRAMVYDESKDALFIGSNKGLIKYQKGKYKYYTIDDGLPTNQIQSLYLLESGKLAVGTRKEGVLVFDGNQFTKIRGNEQLKNAFIHSLLEDKKGNLWIGTGDYAFKYNGNKIVKFGKRFGFCNSYIGDMVLDKLGRIWFATDRCVNMYDGRNFHTFSLEDGLNSTTIYLMEKDGEGNIWVGTNNGLNKIVLSNDGAVKKIINYDENKGFFGVECNTKASFCDNEGNLWFGTVNGLFKYISINDKKITPPPLVYISSVKLLLDTVNWETNSTQTGWFHLPQNHSFKHNQNNFSFNFISIHKKFPYHLTFSYKLEGFENKWRPKTTNNSVVYSNLPPGEYIFKVKSISQSGAWSKADKYSFTIKAPFWSNWWFSLLILIFLVCLILFIIRFREKRRKNFQKTLEKMVKERTFEITQQKEEIELLFKEVHHRVKNNMQVINSLISIQSSYIDDQKAQVLFEDCKNRIRSMALIHEKLYESQDLRNVSIQEYVSNLINHLITAYEIESKINLKEKIEVSSFSLDIIIPLGLIINEIVSNSLKHAFKEKNPLQTNTIFFALSQVENNLFEMEIGDNGSGFDHNLFTQGEDTLGIELIKILTEQINGHIQLLNKKGTWYKIIFHEE